MRHVSEPDPKAETTKTRNRPYDSRVDSSSRAIFTFIIMELHCPKHPIAVKS
jgi:hypothetical protein